MWTSLCHIIYKTMTAHLKCLLRKTNEINHIMVALDGNYVAKSSNGWYCAIDTASGELLEPKGREK
jgi:hypothetical protein